MRRVHARRPAAEALTTATAVGTTTNDVAKRITERVPDSIADHALAQHVTKRLAERVAERIAQRIPERVADYRGLLRRHLADRHIHHYLPANGRAWSAGQWCVQEYDAQVHEPGCRLWNGALLLPPGRAREQPRVPALRGCVRLVAAAGLLQEHVRWRLDMLLLRRFIVHPGHRDVPMPLVRDFGGEAHARGQFWAMYPALDAHSPCAAHCSHCCES